MRCFGNFLLGWFLVERYFVSPRQVAKFLNSLSVFSMFLQCALVFLQEAILKPVLQKIIFLSLVVRFLIRFMELYVKITCWKRFLFYLFLQCLLPLACQYTPRICCCFTVQELFFWRKNFCGPPELFLDVFDGSYRKGFWFFYPCKKKKNIWWFVFFAGVIWCYLNFLPNKFLSCCWRKYLNISFDCCGARPNAEILIYLLW